MNIETRTITPDDAKDVQSLSKQLGYEMSLDDTVEQINEILSSKNDFAAVAVRENKIIGWIHVFRTIRLESKPFVEIGGLVVDEKYRSKGIGRKLIGAIKQWCSQNNVYDLRVRSNVKRNDAHQFYASVGFNETKQQKVFKINL